MVVVLAALHTPFAGIPCAVLPGLQAGSRDPVAVGRILVFIDPRYDAAIVELEPLRLRVDPAVTYNAGVYSWVNETLDPRPFKETPWGQNRKNWATYVKRRTNGKMGDLS
jgi:hypothetical protein